MASLPKLRGDLKITRQVQRDGVYYVIKDPLTQEYYRFPEEEFQLIELFNGERSPEQIEKEYNRRHPQREADLEAVGEFHGSLQKLHLLEKSLAEQNLFLLEKQREQRKSKLLGAKGSLMYFRVSLLDPDPLLNIIYPRIKWIYTPAFLAFGALCVLVACAIIFQRYDAFLEGLASITTFADKTPWALFGLWATVVIVIFFHELGHAFTCKHFGGEVHEMGLLMLFFTPCFYANVNDAWTFPKRYQKLAVTFAGGLTEFFIGSVAAMLWFFLNPGSIAGGVCYQVMTVCAFSSVMFNFNPLMKLDGYYAFSDFVEIPNLKAESAGYVKYMVQKYLFRMPQEDGRDQYTKREKRILFGYGVCSIIYMTGVMMGLFFLARGLLVDNLGGIGVVLSFLVAWKLFKGYFFKLKGFFVNFFKQKQSWMRRRPIITTCLALLSGALIYFSVSRQTLQISKTGSLTPRESHKIFAPLSGFITQSAVRSGQKVQPGETLAVLVDPEKQEALETRIHEKNLEAYQLARAKLGGNVEGNALSQNRIETTLSELNREIRRAQEEIRGGVVTSPVAGIVKSSQAAKGYKPYFNKGSEVFEVVRTDSFYLELTLLESELGDARPGDAAEVKLSGHPRKTLPGTIEQIAAVSTSYGTTYGSGREEEEEGVEHKFTLRVSLEPQPGVPLYPGMRGTVRLYFGKVRGIYVIWHHVRKLIRPDLFI